MLTCIYLILIGSNIFLYLHSTVESNFNQSDISFDHENVWSTYETFHADHPLDSFGQIVFNDKCLIINLTFSFNFSHDYQNIWDKSKKFLISIEFDCTDLAKNLSSPNYYKLTDEIEMVLNMIFEINSWTIKDIELSVPIHMIIESPIDNDINSTSKTTSRSNYISIDHSENISEQKMVSFLFDTSMINSSLINKECNLPIIIKSQLLEERNDVHSFISIHSIDIDVIENISKQNYGKNSICNSLISNEHTISENIDSTDESSNTVMNTITIIGITVPLIAFIIIGVLVIHLWKKKCNSNKSTIPPKKLLIAQV